MDAIANAIGTANKKGKASSTARRHIKSALDGRNSIDVSSQKRKGQVTTLYRLAEDATARMLGVEQ